MTPVVSVIMAAYNGAAFLPETLATLFGQTLPDWELIVADDCSKDDTRDLLRSFFDPRIRLIELPENGGPVRARNAAFAEARGRYIVGLDQDDLALPTRFAKQAAHLDAHPDTVLVTSAVALIHEGSERAPAFARGMSPTAIDWQLQVRNPLVWSSVMFRADAARRLDPLGRPEYRYAEDYDIYHRLRPFGRIVQLDTELTAYRVHAQGASKQFTETMYGSAGRVMAEAHARLLGAPTPEDTALLVRHVMGREPVPDLATLGRLFAFVARLRDALVAERGYDAAAQAEIDGEIARLWWQTCRTGIRAGALPLRKTLAALPGRVSPRLAERADMLVSGVLGGVRALRA